MSGTGPDPTPERPESRRVAQGRRRTTVEGYGAFLGRAAGPGEGINCGRAAPSSPSTGAEAPTARLNAPRLNAPRLNVTFGAAAAPPRVEEPRAQSRDATQAVTQAPGIRDPRPRLALLDAELDSSSGSDRPDWEAKAARLEFQELERLKQESSGAIGAALIAATQTGREGEARDVARESHYCQASGDPSATIEGVATAKVVARRQLRKLGDRGKSALRSCPGSQDATPSPGRGFRPAPASSQDIRDERLERNLRAVFASFAVFGDWRPREVAVPGAWKTRMGFRKFAAAVRGCTRPGRATGREATGREATGRPDLYREPADRELLGVFKERADPLTGTADFDGFLLAVTDLAALCGGRPADWLLAVAGVNEERLVLIDPAA